MRDTINTPPRGARPRDYLASLSHTSNFIGASSPRARVSRGRVSAIAFFFLFTRARAARDRDVTNERDGCETMRSSAAGDLRANDYIIIPSLVRRARRRVVARGVKTRDDDARSSPIARARALASRRVASRCVDRSLRRARRGGARARRPTHESIAPLGRPDRSRARAVRVIHPREIGCFCILYARESAVVRARD